MDRITGWMHDTNSVLDNRNFLESLSFREVGEATKLSIGSPCRDADTFVIGRVSENGLYVGGDGDFNSNFVKKQPDSTSSNPTVASRAWSRCQDLANVFNDCSKQYNVTPLDVSLVISGVPGSADFVEEAVRPADFHCMLMGSIVVCKFGYRCTHSLITSRGQGLDI
ncbi:hypothetical protein DL93DRAFT_1791968 [Clavulina sp. PMI_390]|nr:hypothetical protein DL93DRAFT_1791968 [Clavulina sp. PMI_390]